MHKQVSPEPWGTTYTKQGKIVYGQIVNKHNSQTTHLSSYLSVHLSIYPSIFYLSISVLKICPACNCANFRNCVNWSFELTRMTHLNLSSNEPSLPMTGRLDWEWDTFIFLSVHFPFPKTNDNFSFTSKSHSNINSSSNSNSISNSTSNSAWVTLSLFLCSFN